MVDPFIEEEVIEVDQLKRQIMEVIELDHLGGTKLRYSPYI